MMRPPRLSDRVALTALAGSEAAAAAFNPAVASRVLVDPGGEALGLVMVWGEPPYARLGCLHVLDERAPASAGARLLRWAERAARELAGRAPAGERVLLVAAVDADDPAACARLSAAGFAAAGRIVRMEGALPLNVAPAELPPGASFAAVEAAGWAALYDAWREAFAADRTQTARTFDAGLQKWREDITAAPGYDPALCIGVMLPEGEAAALAVAYTRSPEGQPVGWVEWVAVRPGWRGHGLARALLAELSARLLARGVEGVALTVDAVANPDAVRLYERAGLRATAERIAFEKPLR